MHHDERVVDELEALQAILMEELKIKTNERGMAVGIETLIHPWTALDAKQQYVCVTLEVDLPRGYPDTRPILALRAPRGLDDTTLSQIEEEIRHKCQQNIGQPVLFEMIEIVKERLTQSNVPHCECCICLYGFRRADELTKTPCYHYFHSHCLAGHIKASERIFREEQDKLPPWQQSDTFQAVCPVCRAGISYDVEALGRAAAPQDLTEAPRSFQPTPELRRLQKEMAALYLYQQSRGGIIQPQTKTLLLTTEEEESEGDNR